MAVSAMGDKEHARKTYDVPEFPDRLHIQTQSWCNAACIFCPYPFTSKVLPMGKMSWDLYRKIIDEASRHDVQRCALLLMNEPLLDPDLPARIKYAKERFQARTELMITSNGSVLTDEKIKGLVESGLDRIKVSIQGLDPEVYRHTMGGLKYDKTIAGVKKLIKAVRASERKRPKVMLSIVATGSNEREVRRFKLYWRLRGVKATSVIFENKAGNVKLTSELAPHGLRPFKTCYRPFRTFYVLWNGDVIPCCADWGKKLVLGNVQKSTIKEIWHGEPATKLRESIKAWDMGTLPNICKACSKATAVGAHHIRPLRKLAKLRDRMLALVGLDRHVTADEDEEDG